MSSPENPSSPHPERTRLYASSGEKVAAFRERNKDAGLLRKEVLVQSATSQKLVELAKTHNTSVTNVASGLLELGLTQFEALRSQGYVSADVKAGATDTPEPEPAFENLGQPIRACVPRPLGAVSGELGAASSSSLGLLSSPPPVASADPAPIAQSTEPHRSLQIDNPITNFFEKRKQLSK